MQNMSHMSNQFTMYLLKYIYITTFKMYIEYIYVSHISFRKENHLCKAPLISTSSLTSSYPMSPRYSCIASFSFRHIMQPLLNSYLKDEEVDVDAAGEDEEDGEKCEGHDDLLENLTCSRPTPSRQIFFIHKRKILKEKVRKHMKNKVRFKKHDHKKVRNHAQEKREY